jgi:hypothetical protein
MNKNNSKDNSRNDNILIKSNEILNCSEEDSYILKNHNNNLINNNIIPELEENKQN